MKILGIETSCDETGVALYDSEQGLLGHRLYSQIKVHAEYGGVVPELASRDHVRKLMPLLDDLLKGCQLDIRAIDAIAYTAGPGLVGALLVGVTTARSLAWSLGIPAMGIHHMEGHLLAPLMEDDPPDYPFLALLVSGGHTMLVDVKALGEYQILGESVDDAVGEAFDKTAKLLGLPYPGGPELARLAEQGNPERFRFPRPMTDRPGMDFSFSGLKTFALNTFKANEQDENIAADIARAFQDAVVDTLTIKCKRALEHTGANQLVIAGGVGANKALRVSLQEMLEKRGGRLYCPRMEFCTDNGAMIAYAGYCRYQAGKPVILHPARPRWSLEEIESAG